MGDLLYHAPHRYLDATRVTPLAQARVGEEVSGVGRVVSTGVIPTRRGLRVFRAILRDESGLVECAWPGQPFLERTIKRGQLLLVTGPVRYYHGRQIVPREFILLADAGEEGPDQGLVLPIYPATEGLTHRQIRGLVHQHLDALLALADDPHPRALRDTVGVPDLRTALAAVHRPAALGAAGAGRAALGVGRAVRREAGAGARRGAGEAGRGGHRLGAEEPTPHPPQGAPAVRADGRPAARGARDLGRFDGAAPHAPAAHGRRGNRENGRGAVRDARRAGERLPGRDHGADRAAGRAARCHAGAAARAARVAPRAARRAARRRRPAGGAGAGRPGRRAPRGGEARPESGIRARPAGRAPRGR